MPTRIQRQRKKGWRVPPHTLYIGRSPRTSLTPSRWGNPYPVATYGRIEALRRFREGLEAMAPGALDYELSLLAQYEHLMCWCALEEACHGDIWLEFLVAREKGIP